MSNRTVICERLVQSDRDMLDIEKCIVGELGGENNRCAFFRTLAYVRLRIAALYLPNKAPQSANYSDLQVLLTPSEQGPWVTVSRRFNEPVGGDECMLEAGLCQKRTRCE
jgi:hypothetical protein